MQESSLNGNLRKNHQGEASALYAVVDYLIFQTTYLSSFLV
jgi:hypothetical protein